MLNSPVEEIKSRLDIVEVVGSYIKLEKAGANYRARCPFHSEKSPSFFVSPARQLWHCFGSCSEGGDIFKFVMKIEGVEFGDALRILAKKAGVELKKEDPKIKTERKELYEISELASQFFEAQLHKGKGGAKAKKYLEERGVKEEIMKDWRIGYSPSSWRGLSDFLVGKGYKRERIAKAGLALKSKDQSYYDRFRGRIIFPILNLSSQVVGFGGRVFNPEKESEALKEAKYLNIPSTLLYDKSRILYGLDKAGMAIREKGFCILVEGYLDAIMVSQAGFKNVAATSGTALTEHQLKIIKRYTNEIYTAFDMDVAGDSATKRGIELAQSLGFDIKVVTMPEDKDPADIIKEDSSKWEKLLAKARNIHDFYFQTTFSRFDKNTLEGKKKISEILIPVIRKIPNSIEKRTWIKDLAEDLGVKEEDVLSEVQKGGSKNTFKESYSEVKEKKQRSRKELLEDHLLSLAVAFPKNCSLLKKEDFDLLSENTGEIVECVKKGDLKNEKHKEKIDYLSLKSEFLLDTEDIDVCEDFKLCLREIKSLEVREKLNRIALEIKKAEKEQNPEKINKLMKEFNSYSKSWGGLNTA